MGRREEVRDGEGSDGALEVRVGTRDGRDDG